MVQHTMPKGFKRIRYYGVQATKTFAKVEGVVKGAVKMIARLTYRQRYEQNIRLKVPIATDGLPKNLTRFFVRKRALVACSSRSHGRFYVAKWQGYMANSLHIGFSAILCPFIAVFFIILKVVYS